MEVLVYARFTERAQALVNCVCVAEESNTEGTLQQRIQLFLFHLLHMGWEGQFSTDYHGQSDRFHARLLLLALNLLLRRCKLLKHSLFIQVLLGHFYVLYF